MRFRYINGFMLKKCYVCKLIYNVWSLRYFMMGNPNYPDALKPVCPDCDVKLLAERKDTICSIESCEKEVHSKKFCKYHYKKFRLLRKKKKRVTK